MKHLFLVYEGCCFYEIVTMGYFLRYSGLDTLYVTPDGESVACAEGFRVQADQALPAVDVETVGSVFVPGGRTRLDTKAQLHTPAVYELLNRVRDRGALVAGICAGVDVLEAAGLLRGLRSTHSEAADCLLDHGVLTARANAYIDFALEGARALGLFANEEDLRETADFWKRRIG